MNARRAPTLLVTRPEPGATDTAKKLSDLGLEVIVQPFTEMVPVSVPDGMLTKNSYDAVVVTSANALRYLDDRSRQILRSCPVYSVGDKTADAARDAGFEMVHSADGDGAKLVALVEAELKPSGDLLYLCGKTRTPIIETALARLNYRVTVLETYKTQIISHLTDKINLLFSQNSIDGILFYSGVSAAIFSDVSANSKLIQAAEITQVFCISERAKTKLPSHLQDRTVLSPNPRDDVMIETIRSYYAV